MNRFRRRFHKGQLAQIQFQGILYPMDIKNAVGDCRSFVYCLSKANYDLYYNDYGSDLRAICIIVENFPNTERRIPDYGTKDEITVFIEGKLWLTSTAFLRELPE
jgi:hypothetical protein